MPDISKEESDIVGLALLKSKIYLIMNEKRFDQQTMQDMQSRMNQAMAAMQEVSKRMKSGVPSGGSAAKSKQDKIADLFESYGLTKRIG